MTPRQKLKAIDELMASDGWRVISEVMQQEIVGAAMGMANSAQMPEAEMHFRRGSIWAANQLVDLPTRLRHKLQSEAALSENLGDPDDSKTL